MDGVSVINVGVKEGDIVVGASVVIVGDVDGRYVGDIVGDVVGDAEVGA
jgi:hypothetical protein